MKSYKDITREDIEMFYMNDEIASTKSASVKLECSRPTLEKAIKEFGMKTKDRYRYLKPRVSSNEKIRDKEWLKKRYLVDKMSIKQIAKEINSTVGNVHSALTWIGVKTRNPKESQKVKYPKGKVGRLNPRWNGGKFTRSSTCVGIRSDIKSGNYKNSKYLTSRGYVLVYLPEHPNCNTSNYVFEHRFVMEKYLGRYLTKEELVHHINGYQDDNRIENLQLCNKREHARIHFDAVRELDEAKKEIKQLKEKILNLRKGN